MIKWDCEGNQDNQLDPQEAQMVSNHIMGNRLIKQLDFIQEENTLILLDCIYLIVTTLIIYIYIYILGSGRKKYILNYALHLILPHSRVVI